MQQPARQGVQAFVHRTVLLDEAVEALIVRRGGVYVDGTFGRGGHSRRILEGLDAQGRLLAFDKDPEAAREAASVADPRFAFEHASFAQMAQVLKSRSVAGVSGVLLDLGISSPQIDDGARGFSFRLDGPLDMRMDTTRGLSAAQWLAQADEGDIAKVIRDYGEERFAVPIAKAIAARREQAPTLGTLERTGELAALVARVVKTREKGQDPATRTFQALRIFINQELEDLESGLNAALESLETGGRLVVISFHSLEDRIVKQFINGHARPQGGVGDARARDVWRRLPLRDEALPAARLKPLARMRPSAAEVALNPRARSAVMRIAEKLQ